MGELSPRASYDDRERAVLDLREHLVHGRLTLDEFSERVELAYQARSIGDLEAATSALPTAPTGRGRRRPVRATIGFFAHVVRRGWLPLGRRGVVLGGFSDVDLDLRGAEIAGLVTDLYVLLGFGNVDVYVPEHVGIDVTGITVFGHRRQWGREQARPDSPVLRVRVLAFFGTVDVWHVPTGLRGDYGEITAALQAGQRELPG
ncbi:MAG TPA: DUF1707 domain-containing protein [Gaiellaceae bacterium]|nr:DUF1707 domain-containing protein [Gaiellaceae bacterium]